MRLFHDKVYHILLISSGMGCKCQDTVVLFNEISGGNPLECIHCSCSCMYTGGMQYIVLTDSDRCTIKICMQIISNCSHSRRDLVPQQLSFYRIESD